MDLTAKSVRYGELDPSPSSGATRVVFHFDVPTFVFCVPLHGEAFGRWFAATTNDQERLADDFLERGEVGQATMALISAIAAEIDARADGDAA